MIKPLSLLGLMVVCFLFILFFRAMFCVSLLYFGALVCLGGAFLFYVCCVHAALFFCIQHKGHSLYG